MRRHLARLCLRLICSMGFLPSAAMSAVRKLCSCVLLLGALAATLARTVRWPNDWSEAHWLLDYRFGFVKRALPGEVLSLLTGGHVGEGAIRTAGVACFALLTAAVLFMVFRILRAARWHSAVVIAMVAFVTSPYVVLMAHLVGYFEQLYLVIGFVSILLAQRGRLLFGSLLQALALLVHESSIVVVFPAFTLAAMLRVAHTPDGERRGSLWWLLLPLSLAALMGRVIGSPPDGFQQAFIAWLHEHQFINRDFAKFAAGQLCLPLAKFMEITWRDSLVRLSFPIVYGMVLPTMAALLMVATRLRRLQAWSFEAVAVAFVVLVPQAMHIVAYDVERIASMSLITALFAVWILAEQRVEAAGESAGAAPEFDGGLAAISLLAVVANGAMTPPLLDYVTDRTTGLHRLWLLVPLLLGLMALHATGVRSGWAERWRVNGRNIWQLISGR